MQSTAYHAVCGVRGSDTERRREEIAIDGCAFVVPEHGDDPD